MVWYNDQPKTYAEPGTIISGGTPRFRTTIYTIVFQAEIYAIKVGLHNSGARQSGLLYEKPTLVAMEP